jgi:hypothetical protein
VKRSGRSSAAFHATGEPQSCPTMVAVSWGSSPSRPTMSATSFGCVYFSGARGLEERPKPRRSGATTW